MTKSDTLESKLDEKLAKIENTLRAEINGIKRDLETYKEGNYKETKLIKRTIHHLEAIQSLLPGKYEDHKEKIQQLISDNKKLFLLGKQKSEQFNRVTITKSKYW